MSTCSIIITTQVVLGEGIKESGGGRKKEGVLVLAFVELLQRQHQTYERERERGCTLHTCFRF
jgi:hypothetical protein